MRLVPRGGVGSEGEVPTSGEFPSPAGASVGTEGEFRGLSEESSVACNLKRSVACKTESDLHRQSMSQPCALYPETCVCHREWGLGAGTWGLESKPGKGCEETA